ncbi:MAG TPA: Em GEA1 (EM1) [Methanocellaceae archaeon]
MEEKTVKCKVSVREAGRLIGAKLSRTHGHEFYEDTSHKDGEKKTKEG